MCLEEGKECMRYVEKLTNSGYPNRSTRLNIELGNHLLIKVPNVEAAVKSTLIGLEPQQYLIVRAPVGLDDQNHLSKNIQLNVSYISVGATYGFESKIIGIISEPAKLLFLSYPDVVKEQDQRQMPRVSCHIPATATINQTPLNGIITDMSYIGCRFVVRIPAKITPYQVRILTDVNLRFALHGLDGSEELLGVVRNTSIDRFRIALGIEYDNLSPETSTKIKEYMEKLIGY
jgi:c-di-GMP-binding flagellar brake protein YcgR